jgi:hypothetical protein
MYEHWSLGDINPEKLSSSILQYHFVEKEQCRQQIRTQLSQTKTGIQLTQSVKQMHHPAAHTWRVWRTFEMPLIEYFTAITTLDLTTSELHITSKNVLQLANGMKHTCINHAHTYSTLANDLLPQCHCTGIFSPTECMSLYQSRDQNH